MRQRLGQKKTNKLREQTGLPIEFVTVRGGTNHRKDLCINDGTVWHLYKTGELVKQNYFWDRYN